MFRFATLQSDIGKQIAEIYSINSKSPDSILLYEHEKWVSHKSTAAIKIASKLGFPSNLLVIFYIIPPLLGIGFTTILQRTVIIWYGKKRTVYGANTKN